MPPGKTFKKTNSIQSDKSMLNSVVDGPINSPLQRFVRAKRRVNKIFDDIFTYLKESRAFLLDCDILNQTDNGVQKSIQQVDGYLSQVVCINEVLLRDHMKVAFFGRTSNGKSTVVNAMLSDKILPAGIGHTTNCFVSVIGADGSDAYMEDSITKDRKSVASLQQLAHALHNNKLDISSLLNVYWPKSECPLLKDDVVFVDSPGIDVTPDLDCWIDKHCLDADVFVLVVNSESTLNQTEKSFFHKVNTRLSKPNIFILNNRWDASADGEPEMIKLVRQQHLDRTTEFLVDELKCVSRVEAADRIFFVSALEMLRYRISHKNARYTDSPLVEEDNADTDFKLGKIARRQEFEDFETKFKECISKSAIITKFYSHATTGIMISKEMINHLEQVLAKASSQRAYLQAEREEVQDSLEYMSSQLALVTEQIKLKIKNISEEIGLQVSKAMSEEIRRLGHLVGDFDYPFHPHSGFLKNYKQELHTHIEKGLGKNLKARCSAPLLESIEEYKSAMKDKIFSLIPASACSSTIPATPKTNFSVSYELDVPNLCSDFQEDISFQFSLGWSNLISKYVAPRNPRLAFMLGATFKPHMINLPPDPLTVTPHKNPSDQAASKNDRVISIRQNLPDPLLNFDDDELTMAVIQGLSSLSSSTAMAFVVAVSLVWKAVGWKLVALGVSSYVTIYLYERAMWTNAAKEKTFKKQFVEYATERLRLIVSFTSKGCSHQIEQELSHTFAQLASQADVAKIKIEERIQELNEEIQRLEEIESKAKLLRNKGTFIENDLTSFVKDFNLSVSKI
ncbi:mitofusin-2 isoform X2 [Hydra vulgaris]|uniref:Mitofusin-2 isoform X2 n=1 Tax=Hydra vulgaris TaxID=6087 RepID=A0ABM4C4R7_HYDVU